LNKNNVVRDDIRHPLFIACTAASEKVNTTWAGCSVDAASAQRAELASFWKRRSESVGDWCNGKGISLAYFGMTATSRNANEVFSLGSMLHRRC